MECLSNFRIAFFFTKVEYKENFRNKKSKQYIKGALPLIRKKQNKKDNNAYDVQKAFASNPKNIPVSKTNLFLSSSSTLAM